MKYMQNLPSGGYLGKLANNSANGKRPFFIFWGCNMVPVPKERKNVNKQLIMTRKKIPEKNFVNLPCSIMGPPRVRGQVPPLQKLSLCSLLRFFLPGIEKENVK